MKIRACNVRIFGWTTEEDVEATFDQMVAYGANGVAITFSYYVSMRPGTAVAAWPPQGFGDGPGKETFIWADRKQDPAHPFGNTPTVEFIHKVCKLAKRKFQYVLLKPHIDSYDAHWRGAISVYGVERAFSVSYRKDFLGPLLPIVKELDIDLCMGTELVQITRELGAKFWIRLHEWLLEQGVTQPVTYAANWGWELSAEWALLRKLWGRLAYIGGNAYPPQAELTYTKLPTVEELVSGEGNIGWHRRLADASGKPHAWCPSTVEALTELSKATERDVLLTEVGFPNNVWAVHDPAGEVQGAPLTTMFSLPLWQATRIVWDDPERLPFMMGWCAWEAGPPSSEAVTSHNVLTFPEIAKVVLSTTTGGNER